MAESGIKEKCLIKYVIIKLFFMYYCLFIITKHISIDSTSSEKAGRQDDL